MNKQFWKATLIRCVRTFLTTILGVWSAGQIVTEIDWKATLLSAVSATIYILLVCIVGGLPEVEAPDELTEEEVENTHWVELGDMDEEAK